MRCVLLVMALVLGCGAARAMPSPTGRERALLEDGADGKLDSMSLLEASLIASGVADGALAREMQAARAALAPAVARARTQRDPKARGSALLRALHETVLRRYRLSASAIDDAIRSGEFNCLSSAVLFVVAAEGLLEDPRAMLSEHHAYARVSAAGKSVDVETTTPLGFDPDRKRLMTPSFVQQIAGAHVTPAELLADLRHTEELPVLALVAAVYSNRAVGALERGDDGDAALALDRAARLSTGAQHARVSEWRSSVLGASANELIARGQLDDARATLALALDGARGELRAKLRHNLGAVEQGLARRALEASDWNAALAHARAAQEAGAPAEAWRPLEARAQANLAAQEGSARRCMAAQHDARAQASCLSALSWAEQAADPEGAVAHARAAFARVKSMDTERALFAALVRAGDDARKKRACAHAEAFVKEALAHASAVQEALPQSNEMMAACFIDLGAAAFESKRWDDAAHAYARAIVHLPNDVRLRSNLARIDFNRAIAHAEAGRCDEARPLVMRAARLEHALADKGTTLLESCAIRRAQPLLERHAWAEALAELRRGMRDAPTSTQLRDALQASVHNLAVELLQSKKCDDARALLPELERIGDAEATSAVRHNCT